MMKKLHHLLSCLSMLAIALLPRPLLALDALPEYTVKAGFVYNFAMLTDWPPGNTGGGLNVCVLGSSELLQALNSIHGKVVNNRRIDVRPLESVPAAKECHVLFLTEADRMVEARLLREIATLPILTVTDDEGIANKGAIIFLRPERQRLVFEINVAAARSANLMISSRLLRLARGGASE